MKVSLIDCMLLCVKLIYFNALCVTELGLMHFGLLRNIESLMSQQKHLSLRADHIDAQFSYPAKFRCEGFMLKCPEWMLDAFDICIEQLDYKRLIDSRFISNMNEKKDARTQNMGEHVESKR